MESEEELAFAINAQGVGALSRVAREIGARLMHISTDFVFDGERSCPYAPGDRRAPLSVYGRSKAAGEDAVGPDATVVRTSWLYAAGSANFVTTMLGLMHSREKISVVADQTGAPTWATGLANALWRLAEDGRTGIFHHSDAASPAGMTSRLRFRRRRWRLGCSLAPHRCVPSELRTIQLLLEDRDILSWTRAPPA